MNLGKIRLNGMAADTQSATFGHERKFYLPMMGCVPLAENPNSSDILCPN